VDLQFWYSRLQRADKLGNIQVLGLEKLEYEYKCLAVAMISPGSKMGENYAAAT
jgi:hypothetical protein